MNVNRRSPPPAALSAGQRALLQHKIHVDPGAWAQSDAAVRRRLPSAWSAALRLVDLLHALPDEALLWWAHRPRGHLLLTAEAAGYCAGERVVGEHSLTATALVPIHQVVLQADVAAICSLHVLDHLLGSDGEASGGWLSDGHGRSPRWQHIGSQIALLFPLGYGLSEAGRQDARRYLAEALWTAMYDRARLNVADPKLERLLHHSILDAGFWRNFLKEEADATS